LLDIVKIEERFRKLVIAKIQDDSSQRQLSNDLRICRNSIQNIWLKFANTGSIADRPRNGKPMKSTEWDRRRLCMAANKIPFLSVREHGESSDLIPKVSVITVFRYLRKCGLCGLMSAMKPLLWKFQIKQRLQWCKACLSYTAIDCDQVVFSDECKMATHSNSRRYVCRPKHSKYNDKYSCKTVKYGLKSCLVWGSIWSDGNCILIQYPHRLDSREYMQVWSKGLSEVYESHKTFMQDGAHNYDIGVLGQKNCHHKKCVLNWRKDWENTIQYERKISGKLLRRSGTRYLMIHSFNIT